MAVAYIHPDEVSQSFHESLMSMLGHDLSNEGHLATGGWIAIRCYGGDALPLARNNAVEEFLKGQAEWLFWIDSDMGFKPDTIDRLLEVADKDERPVIGALCFAYKQTDPDGMGGWRSRIVPTIFDWEKMPDSDGSGFMSAQTFPVNMLMECRGTGSACILIHRSVLEKMKDKFDETWYNRVPNPTNSKSLIGEDLSFCIRLGSLNIPLYVHTGVTTTHHKPRWVGSEDYWAQSDPPQATERTAIIVPVLDRPQNAKPFMQSLRATSGLCRVYAVCDARDEASIKAWSQHKEVKVIKFPGDVAGNPANPGTFAEKVNYAYRKINESWMFVCGDDVKFHSRWLDHAQQVAGDQFNVIGTNDLGNPRVMSGEHATHLLIRKSYVDEVGASWDGAKVVCHEGYAHCFVDDEIVTAAKQRGVWAFAMGSTVEHLHPFWDKAETDSTYQLGQSKFVADQAVFVKRLDENK